MLNKGNHYPPINVKQGKEYLWYSQITHYIYRNGLAFAQHIQLKQMPAHSEIF